MIGPNTLPERVRRFYRSYRQGNIRIGHSLIKNLLERWLKPEQEVSLRSGLRLKLDLSKVNQAGIFWYNGEFDTCLCLEGIEHVVDLAALIQEFCRITKSGGLVIISLPNVQNLFSRFRFLCTGSFYQFTPWGSRHLQPGEPIDRGHVSPLSYLQLRDLFSPPVLFGQSLILVFE
jgi:SAM-dependent methyltransferase